VAARSLGQQEQTPNKQGGQMGTGHTPDQQNQDPNRRGGSQQGSDGGR
jgi:hypothetical protein